MNNGEISEVTNQNLVSELDSLYAKYGLPKPVDPADNGYMDFALKAARPDSKEWFSLKMGITRELLQEGVDDFDGVAQVNEWKTHLKNVFGPKEEPPSK